MKRAKQILPKIVSGKIVEKGILLIDFTTPWCAPCKAQAPIIKALARKFKEKAIIVEVNVNEEQELAHNFEIQNIPTLVLFKNGNEVDRFVGLHSEKFLTNIIENALDEQV